jgi:fatty acid desaturase
MEVRRGMAAVFLLCLVVSLRIADHLYYRDSEPVLRLLRLTAQPGQRGSYYKKYDHIFATFPFLWAWADLLLLGLAAAHFAHPVVYLVVVVVAGGRFRVLQEASHIAVHGGLCKSRRWQWAISDVAAQWPCFRPDMYHRHIAHVLEHHAHANELDDDPNITRFIAVGVVPGISRASLRAKMLRPLSARGLIETLQADLANALHRNHRKHGFWLRSTALGVVVGAFAVVSGPIGLLVAYAIPLVTVYPLFSWVSVLAEHRWFVRCDEVERKARECVNGRPTDYRGLGRLAKHTIFPFTDHYHLAHSLYPTLRWNYLPAVDRALRERDPRYARFASEGLFRARADRQSALSELLDRLTTPDYPDVAEWAKDLTSARPHRPIGASSTLVTG